MDDTRELPKLGTEYASWPVRVATCDVCGFEVPYAGSVAAADGSWVRHRPCVVAKQFADGMIERELRTARHIEIGYRIVGFALLANALTLASTLIAKLT